MKTEKESLSALTPKILSRLLYWFSLDLTCHLVIESLTLEELCDLSMSLISQRGHFWSSDKLISFRCSGCESVSLTDTLHMFSHLSGTHNGTTETLWWCWTADSLPAATTPFQHPSNTRKLGPVHLGDLAKLDPRGTGQGRWHLCNGHSSS